MRDVVAEVRAFLERQAQVAISAGVDRSRIILDPGLGFAKNARHNLALMGGLSELCALGYPVLVGASRKRFVRAIAGDGESDASFRDRRRQRAGDCCRSLDHTRP